MTLLDYKVEEIAFMFMLFCNIGWIQESAIESFYHRRLINRGFLKGPHTLQTEHRRYHAIDKRTENTRRI